MKKEVKPYVEVRLTWDCLDQNRCEETFSLGKFFRNEGLKRALAYIDLSRNFKGETSEPRFGDDVTLNEDVPIWDFLGKYFLTTEDSMGIEPDGLEYIEIFLVKGNIYEKITEKVLKPIEDRWREMDYEEIVDEMNEFLSMED